MKVGNKIVSLRLTLLLIVLLDLVSIRHLALVDSSPGGPQLGFQQPEEEGGIGYRDYSGFGYKYILISVKVF